MLRINFLIHVHSAGLRRDLQVFKKVLSELPVQLSVTAFDPSWAPRFIRGVRRGAGAIFRKRLYDINLFVEDVSEAWLPLARVNCLFPHQEWFPDRTRALLPRIDWILCKTHFAMRMFEPIARQRAYTGFTTADRLDPSVPKDYSACVHVAGSSLQKGTATVNDVWLRHPQWPTLMLHWYEPSANPVDGPNVRCVRTYVSEQSMRQTQNRCGIHLCTSEAEGFGHYLVEAMSCGAVVVTTDGPPMNELVTAERGVLVGYNRQSPQGAGINYYIDPELLGASMDRVFGMSPGEREQMGKRAREWFLENDRQFRARFWEVLQGIA